MGQRSRKRGRAAQAGAPAARDAHAQPRPSRTEARNADARAGLEPLAPGERPAAVTVAAIVAVVLAAANLGFYAAGYEVRGASNKLSGLIVFEVLLLAAAAGMWRGRYWAVLGFEALLGITIVIAALSLTVASNVQAALLCVGIVVPAGLLFYRLVRAMARIQMPVRRPPADL